MVSIPAPASAEGSSVPDPAAWIAAALRRDIASGAIAPGAHLDPAVIGRAHHANGIAARTALARLHRAGLVTCRFYRYYAAPGGLPGPAAGARLAGALARLRQAAGMSHEDVSAAAPPVMPVILTSPGTFREAEGGAWQPREFWAAADTALSAGGALLDLHDECYTRREPPFAAPAGAVAGSPMSTAEGLMMITVDGQPVAPGAGEMTSIRVQLRLCKELAALDPPHRLSVAVHSRIAALLRALARYGTGDTGTRQPADLSDEELREAARIVRALRAAMPQTGADSARAGVMRGELGGYALDIVGEIERRGHP